MNTQEDMRASDVAVIGMACRFPGATTVERFWQNLEEGRDAVVFFSDDDLLAAGVAPELLRDRHYVKAGQVLPDIDKFDAEVFKITAEDAEIMDPQQRQFLECAVEAFENAACDPERFPGAIGVYAGVGMNTYLLRNLGERFRSASPLERYRLMLTGDKDFLATRLSYKLNLRGPSVNVNTACSTSLVAVHMACLGLLGGECDVALAGSAHVRIPQVEGYLYQDGMIFSPDGRCRAFDASARGTIVGSGVGVVVLKRLQDALEQRDWIYAVIKGSAINNDGALKASYTAPSVEGQSAAIREAQMLAGCGPETISYIEAHGTGTPLGDPVEIAALKKVFGEAVREHRCAIGSVKTNVGHLDAAAGMAGLIKTCLMLERKRLVPSLHFQKANPETGLDDSPFYVNTAATDWCAGDSPRRAGVSSFGIGGTNTHVVLEEASDRAYAVHTHGPRLLIVSARSAKSLERASMELARHLKQHRDLEIGDVAYTLATGRRHYQHRVAYVCVDTHDAALALAVGYPDRMLAGVADEAPRKCAFVFREHSGAGTYEIYRVASLVMSWGIRPNALVAHGRGILAAGCIAGCFPIEETIRHPIHATAPKIPLWSDALGGWVSEREAADAATWRGGSGCQAASAAPALHGQILVDLDAMCSPSSLLTGLARLWISGAEVDWESVYRDEEYRRVPLPARPFERKRYWVEPPDRKPVVKNGRTLLVEQVHAAPVAARPQLLVQFIQREIAHVLGTDEDQLPDPTANLFELGIDSLTLIEVAARLSKEVEHSISPSVFVDHFTIRAFAANLLNTLGAQDGVGKVGAARA
jgi:acyl transferase domain-containing protein